MKVYFDDNSNRDPRLVYVDDLAPLPQPKPAPAKPARRPLRNWQKFMLCYSLIMAGGVLTAPVWGSTWPSGGPWQLFAVIGLLVWLVAGLIILTVAYQKGRL